MSFLLLSKGSIENCQNNFGRSVLGYYVTTSLSETEGMRIIQAAAGSYYFEDGPSCWSRKPVATPITTEVRHEASEAGQARAGTTGQVVTMVCWVSIQVVYLHWKSPNKPKIKKRPIFNCIQMNACCAFLCFLAEKRSRSWGIKGLIGSDPLISR